MSNDNFRREVAKLKRRVRVRGEPEHFCSLCGQPLRGKRHAELITEKLAEEGKRARDELISTVEAVALRQREAEERKSAQRAAEKNPRGQGLMVTATDTSMEDSDAAARERIKSDPVLKTLLKRRQQREQERALHLVKPPFQTTGGSND